MIVFGDVFVLFFFFKEKTAYEMRISDWSSDVCSSYLSPARMFRKSSWARCSLLARVRILQGRQPWPRAYLRKYLPGASTRSAGRDCVPSHPLDRKSVV